jgi:hypothetical protein
MEKEFEIGDYVFAEDWCYGRIVYIHGGYAEVDFETTGGGGCLSFSFEDLKHAERPNKDGEKARW